MTGDARAALAEVERRIGEWSPTRGNLGVDEASYGAGEHNAIDHALRIIREVAAALPIPAAASEGSDDREAWDSAHGEVCHRGHYCSAHKPGNWPHLFYDLMAARPVTAARTEGREDTKERLQAFLDAHPEAAVVAVPGESVEGLVFETKPYDGEVAESQPVDGWDHEDPRRWIGQCDTGSACLDNGAGYRFHDAACRWGPGATPTPPEVAPGGETE